MTGRLVLTTLHDFEPMLKMSLRLAPWIDAELIALSTWHQDGIVNDAEWRTQVARLLAKMPMPSGHGPEAVDALSSLEKWKSEGCILEEQCAERRADSCSRQRAAGVLGDRGRRAASRAQECGEHVLPEQRRAGPDAHSGRARVGEAAPCELLPARAGRLRSVCTVLDLQASRGCILLGIALHSCASGASRCCRGGFQRLRPA